MSKVNKALGITAAIASIAGVAVGTVAAIKKVKAKKNVTEHECKCAKNKDKCEKSFEEQVADMHKECECDCGDDCTCTVCCDDNCECDDAILNEEITEKFDEENSESLKSNEDCENCNFKDGCKLK